MKRRKTGNPCFLCEKALVECDGNRPCSRCLRNGNPQMCVGTELMGKVAPSPNVTKKETKQSTNGFNHSPKSRSSSKTKTSPVQIEEIKKESTRKPKSSSKQSQRTNGTTTQGVQSKAQTKVKKQVKRVNSNKDFMREENFEFDFGNQNNQSTPSREDFFSPKGAQEIPQSQMSVNSFLMNELKKLKDDQKRLNEEILALKIQNMNLTSRLEKTVAQIPQNSLLIHGASGIDPQKAMVVFDLTKNPAIVLTTNDTFCKMLGYDMKEVIGMPWHKFIHPDYIERTMSILSQRNLKDSVIQFEQVYRHKDGGIFATKDTHTIFFANETPVSDLVFITLAPSSVKLPSPHSRPQGFVNEASLLRESKPYLQSTDISQIDQPLQSISPQPPEYPSLNFTSPQVSFPPTPTPQQTDSENILENINSPEQILNQNTNLSPFASSPNIPQNDEEMKYSTVPFTDQELFLDSLNSPIDIDSFLSQTFQEQEPTEFGDIDDNKLSSDVTIRK